jgi:phospholipid/cholesterol/gamma-HCH transport system permease protein
MSGSRDESAESKESPAEVSPVEHPARTGEHSNGDRSFRVEVGAGTFDELTLDLSGSIHMDNAELVRTELLRIAENEPLKNLQIDLSRVDYFDSSGAAVLLELREICGERDNSVRIVNVPEHFRSLVRQADSNSSPGLGILTPRKTPDFFEQIGMASTQLFLTGQEIVTFIGASVVALWQDLSRPTRVKWDSLATLIERCASDAIPIVTALSFMMGCVLAFQAAIQLRKFGANIFVADLVSVSICIEMGPLLTAMIVAGRSGAGFAAHIGTMQVTEEVDALRIMAIDPMRYLVSPRIIAVALALPGLTLIADMVGILGGCVVAVFSLDLTPMTYLNQVTKILEVSDVAKGLTKSLAFGVEIASIGCFRGFQVRGGAESVGAATTSAVVTSIFVIVATDAIFSMLFHYVRLI